jgi:antitoxin PrlF
VAGHGSTVSLRPEPPIGRRLEVDAGLDVLPFNGLVILKESRMATTLTSKGQVTIPKRIRDAMRLLPGAAVEFSVNAAGEVVLHPAKAARGMRAPARDRFDAVRGRAEVRWRTDELMKLLRADD